MPRIKLRLSLRERSEISPRTTDYAKAFPLAAWEQLTYAMARFWTILLPVAVLKLAVA